MFPQFNSQSASTAERELLECCASGQWARRVAEGRPYPDAEALADAADDALRTLDWAQIEEALSAHPRIGDRAEGTDRESVWSRDEQSAAAGADDDTQAKLRAANVDYERRFGRVFLICATGLGSDAVHAAILARLDNDEATERDIVRGELRKIVRLRVRKLVAA